MVTKGGFPGQGERATDHGRLDHGDSVPEATRARAARVRLVLTDCDGCLTDGGVYYGAEGEVLKRFNIRDGMGSQRLRQAGIAVGIVTGEMSPSVIKRGEKLRLTEVHLGVQDKLPRVNEIAQRLGIDLTQIAYLGDDVNDLEALQAVGFAACPGDAFEGVKPHVHLVLESRGGHGAFREFAEVILAARTPKT